MFIGHVFKRWLLGDTVFKLPQSGGCCPGSGSHHIYNFRKGVMEQGLPPDRYGSFVRIISYPWICELVDTYRLVSSFSLLGLLRFRIGIRHRKFLLGTPRAWMEGHAPQGPFVRIIALLGTNRTTCRRWQGIIHRHWWCGGGLWVSRVYFRRDQLQLFLSSGREASGGGFWLWRIWSRSHRVPEKLVISILEIVRYIWELVVCEFDIWWILSHNIITPRPQGISLPAAEIRTWRKGVGFQYTHLHF